MGMSGAERQRRYRERRAANVPLQPPPRLPRPKTRPARWAAALAELRALQAEYETWRDQLPESLAESRTAELLEGVCDADLDALDVSKGDGGQTDEAVRRGRVSQTAIFSRTRLLAELRRLRKLWQPSAARRNAATTSSSSCARSPADRAEGHRPGRDAGSPALGHPRRHRGHPRAPSRPRPDLYELARALTNDCEEFEKLVDGGAR